MLKHRFWRTWHRLHFNGCENHWLQYNLKQWWYIMNVPKRRPMWKHAFCHLNSSDCQKCLQNKKNHLQSLNSYLYKLVQQITRKRPQLRFFSIWSNFEWKSTRCSRAPIIAHHWLAPTHPSDFKSGRKLKVPPTNLSASEWLFHNQRGDVTIALSIFMYS